MVERRTLYYTSERQRVQEVVDKGPRASVYGAKQV